MNAIHENQPQPFRAPPSVKNPEKGVFGWRRPTSGLDIQLHAKWAPPGGGGVLSLEAVWPNIEKSWGTWREFAHWILAVEERLEEAMNDLAALAPEGVAETGAILVDFSESPDGGAVVARPAKRQRPEDVRFEPFVGTGGLWYYRDHCGRPVGPYQQGWEAKLAIALRFADFEPVSGASKERLVAISRILHPELAEECAENEGSAERDRVFGGFPAPSDPPLDAEAELPQQAAALGPDPADDKKGCWYRALRGEPRFVLLGRDPSAPELVRQWALRRKAEIIEGVRPDSDMEWVDQALTMAEEMVVWRAANDGAWRTPGPATETKTEGLS